MAVGKSSNTAIVISIIAIIIGAAALGVAFTTPSALGQAGPTGPAGSAGPAGQGLTPTTQKLTIIMGEGEIIQEIDGEEQLTGEFHRWEPPVLVVKDGDTVELTVVNPRSNAHSFVLSDYGVDTGRIPGRVEEPNITKRTVTVTFVADKAGVFTYRCGMAFDPDAGNCDPDHARMVGQLIVLAV